mmetsp:Transcript_45771/g.114727  ORF Transcript_45771/g.114727 Transcript_45771/m.114727 type:complete len:335 (+) Transcript_45771:34-1038(+)
MLASRALSRLGALRAFSASRSASTLVLATHDNKTLNPATLSAVTAASKIGGDVTVLVGGHECGAVAEAAAKIAGVAKVLKADHAALAKGLPENLDKLVLKVQADGGHTHVLSATSAVSRGVLPRVAAQLDVDAISDITEVQGEDTFVRPIYAGNALCTVQSADSVKVITARPTSFDKAAVGDAAVAIEDVSASASDSGLSSFVSEELAKSDRPDLAAAPVVVSGGRGMKNGENFQMLYDLADKMGGAVGASRAAVDAGYMSNETQVGQTGKVVAPDLYIACGISGAIQHLAGMKDSKTIVAINKDPEAPIFQVADLGLVDDLFTAVPEMTAAIK